jgi:hypothetical protein
MENMFFAGCVKMRLVSVGITVTDTVMFADGSALDATTSLPTSNLQGDGHHPGFWKRRFRLFRSGFLAALYAQTSISEKFARKPCVERRPKNYLNSAGQGKN